MYHSDPSANNVLVVDDDLAMRRSVIRSLERSGFRCRGAVSNGEARTQLASDDFAIVITDMRMWGEDGLELVRHISDQYPATCTIMMTGFAEARLEERVEQSGGYALFQKPFETEDLLATIQGALQLREEKVAWLRHVSGW